MGNLPQVVGGIVAILMVVGAIMSPFILAAMSYWSQKPSPKV